MGRGIVLGQVDEAVVAQLLEVHEGGSQHPAND